MADFGYDISDYTDVDPVFGTLADFDDLLARAHWRGIKVIVDCVPNHTSDQHPWFVESASSRDSAKRDWYVWGEPAPDGGPPNNWRSSCDSGSTGAPTASASTSSTGSARTRSSGTTSRTCATTRTGPPSTTGCGGSGPSSDRKSTRLNSSHGYISYA